ncbi:MAG: diaminopropionate ammonia-lyase [Firmicutes bacterium]|nr:diaminopropionate ammonia-lyase [Bacillota bacterium]
MKKYSFDDFTVLAKDAPAAWHSGELFTEKTAEKVLRFHKSMPFYKETELKSLPAAAERFGVRAVFVKDESTRFGLNAFKGLGGSYAVFRCLCERLGLDAEKTGFAELQTEEIRKACSGIEFATATDGNHGKGVAWAAGLFGCSSHVYMPHGTVEARRKAIEDAGASDAVITPFNYDKTVAYASRLADENGWVLVQDTAWEGYEDVPRWIIEGYMTLAAESCSQMDGMAPTHVFLQAGVGAMAGGVAGYLLNRFRDHPPLITIVEPTDVACIFLSAQAGDGKARSVEGDPVTIMAGLNCGTPCSIIWPVLRDGASFFCACDDSVTEQGMRAYAEPLGSDPAVVSGESGAVTYGLLLKILRDEELRRLWKIDESSVILLISTEGATDPEGYERIVRRKRDV